MAVSKRPFQLSQLVGYCWLLVVWRVGNVEVRDAAKHPAGPRLVLSSTTKKFPAQNISRATVEKP